MRSGPSGAEGVRIGRKGQVSGFLVKKGQDTVRLASEKDCFGKLLLFAPYTLAKYQRDIHK